MGTHFGGVEVHSLSLSHTFGNMKCDSRVSLLAHTFVSLCLGREPKARVVTFLLFNIMIDPPLAVVNRVGLPWATLPTFLNFLHSHTFQDGGPNMI
jgi:hypothetical protein